MNNFDMSRHLQGKSQYIDDIPEPEGLLHAVIFSSPQAKGRIVRLDTSLAEQAPGVRAVFTANDVPGENQIGHIIRDQPLLASDRVAYIGEPIAFVVAQTRFLAAQAVKLIQVEILPETPIVDPREAWARGEIIGTPKILTLGDTVSTWAKCAHVVSGRVDSGGQEHFYFETQSALAEPVEGGNIKVYASAQAPGGFQRHIAEVLGIPMHRVEVDIRRLGGGFGGKEGCALWAALPAMAAYLLGCPVKLVLSRREDIATSGKRHPYTSDYKIGLDQNGLILAYELEMFQDAGAYTDISVAVLGRSLLHTGSSYFIPNFKVTAVCCRTNTLPNTAFRGFGVPQAVFIMESAIYAAAEKMGLEPRVIQERNLIREGDLFPYEMKVENCTAQRCWQELDRRCDIAGRIRAVEAYNATHRQTKKGIAIMPVCFGISFVQTTLNQAGALVHIYTDGSVGISTGAVEMGQGVNMKILQVAAQAFSIQPHRLKIETTNTARVANASPTSASTGFDLNGMATQKACRELLARLLTFAAQKLQHPEPTELHIQDEIVWIKDQASRYTWSMLVHDAYMARIDLSCHAFYAPPGLHWDAEKIKGRPYTYHSFGTSLTEVTIDCMRGTYQLDAIEVVHDIGSSVNPAIDLGQFEGGIVQGIGWATIENVVYNQAGKLLTTVSSYKMPDIKSIPEQLSITFLENAPNPYAVNSSKAVGEPPFIHGIGTYFALLRALRAIRTDKALHLALPLTPEKVFMYIHGE
jgi:xanthine dehydrogenase large subunit